VIEARAGAGCDELDVCGRARRVCLASEFGLDLTRLSAVAGPSIYPAFFCGTPSNEPTCLLARPASIDQSTIYDGQQITGDSDGDGVPDAADNCPTVFNPVRPLDHGQQADGDGVGDPCDPCPLAAGTWCTTAPAPTTVAI
jgi:hypothetical protein